MSRSARTAAVAAVFLSASAVASPVPKDRPAPRELTPNSNALVKRDRAGLVFSRSTDWQGWPPDKAFDGNPDTSWFSATGDTPAEGKRPWLAVTFPADVAVSRVTVLGNREPGSPVGYTVHVARLELLDADGKVVIQCEREAKGDRADFDFVLCEPFGRVRTVKFTALKDDTSEEKSQTRCVGVAEVMVE